MFGIFPKLSQNTEHWMCGPERKRLSPRKLTGYKMSNTII